MNIWLKGKLNVWESSPEYLVVSGYEYSMVSERAILYSKTIVMIYIHVQRVSGVVVEHVS